MSRRRWRRPGVVYAFWGYDPHELLKGVLKIIVLYVGQTRQKPETRRDQHLKGGLGSPAKPWGDLMTEWKPIWSRKKTFSFWLTMKEYSNIAKMLPQNNIKMNMMNPNRIPPWEQKRLRKERDALGGAAVLISRAKQRDVVAGWHEVDGRPETFTIEWFGNDVEGVKSRWSAAKKADTPQRRQPIKR